MSALNKKYIITLKKKERYDIMREKLLMPFSNPPSLCSLL